MLPSAVLQDHEDQAAYVKTRSVHNKSFFDDVRKELTSLTQGFRVQMLADHPDTTLQPEALVDSQRSLLQALHISKGFLAHREQHKAMILFHLCVEVSDHFVGQMDPTSQVFWQLLARLCLADAYTKFQKLEEALSILQESKRLCEHSDVQPLDAGAKVLEGACHKVVGRVYLEAALGCVAEATERIDEAAAEIKQAVELLEKYLPEVPGCAEKPVEAAVSLATAYSSLGVCDVRAGRFECCFEWFAKAQGALQELSAKHPSVHRVLGEIAEQVKQAKYLQQCC